MATVKENDTVQLAFIGKLANGAVFMEISQDEPLEVTIGSSDLPPTVESGVIGMREGETKTIHVSADEGYGPRLKELLHDVPKNVFANRIDPKPGMILSQKITKDGVEHLVPATVIELKGDTVVLDYNHPLAGHALTYELTVVRIASLH